VNDETTRSETRAAEALSELLAPYAARAEVDLRRWLVEPDTPEALAEAMRYCVLGGGKRLRPALVQMAAEAAGARCDDEPVARAGAAAELVHCYSLVHDDLPAMDDDTLRRGRATAHVRFGEAMAILVGDALLTRAFGILAGAGARAAALAGELARSAGPAGIIAGQAADMDLCDVPAGARGLRFIHLRKTAALFRAAAGMGAIAAGAPDADRRQLRRYAERIGLAFQLVDDMLDVTAGAERLGKTPGKDARDGKRTHVGRMGLRRSDDLARRLTGEALDALVPLGGRGEMLRRLAELLAERTH